MWMVRSWMPRRIGWRFRGFRLAKALIGLSFSARLKPCPDTKHESSDYQKRAHSRRFEGFSRRLYSPHQLTYLRHGRTGCGKMPVL